MTTFVTQQESVQDDIKSIGIFLWVVTSAVDIDSWVEIPHNKSGGNPRLGK